MGKARVEIWDATNTTKLSDTYLLDANLNLRNIDDLPSTGKKLNESGGGGLVIQRDHPAWEHMVPRNCVRLYSDSTLVHTFAIANGEWVRIAKRQRDKTITVDGEDLLDEWRFSKVDPWNPAPDARPVSADRVWNWTSQALDTSDWSTTVYNLTRPAEAAQLEPEAWPVHDIFNAWILSRDSADAHPVGEYLFRIVIDVEEDSDVALYLAADNDAELWVDSTLVERSIAEKPSTEAFTKTHRWALPMTAGEHTIAIKVTNWEGGEINPAGFKFAAAYVNNDGTFGEVIVTSAADFPWICLDLPATFPGFTAPEILQMLLDEAQTRGELPTWTIVTHGEFEAVEEYACRVGSDYRAVLDDMRAMHVDAIAADEGKVLHLWPKGQMDLEPELELDEASIEQLTDLYDGEFFNAVQGVWSDGVRWRYHEDSIAALGVVRSESLQLGSVTEPRAVDQILDAYLEAHAYPVESMVGKFVDLPGKVAGVDYKVGDTITVAGGAARCYGIAWTVDPLTGDLIPHPEWDTLASVRRRERERALERMIAGHDGPATASLLTSKPLVFAGVPQTMEWDWSWSEDIEEALNEIDPDKPWQVKRVTRIMRPWKISVEIDADDLPDAWGTTEIQLLVNGVELNPLYRIALDTTTAYSESWISAYDPIRPQDTVQVLCSVAGGHVDGRVTLHLADPV